MTPSPRLSQRDLLFAAINGGIFGLGFAAVANESIAAIPHMDFIVTMLVFAILAAIGVAIGAWLARWRAFIFQLAKFGVVGVANTAVDLGVFNILLAAVGGVTTATSLPIFKSLSFIAAVINSYVWNKYWSFGKKDQASAGEFGKFLTVSVIGLGLNAGITSLVAHTLAGGGMISSLQATIGAAIASVIVLMWNFLGYKLFVFRR